MTPLREKMTSDLVLRNLAESTRDTYIGYVRRFANFFGRSPAKMGAKEAREYLLHLVDLGRAASTVAGYWAALRFLYVMTLGRPEVMAAIPRPRVRPPQPGRPLTREEMAPILEAAIPAPFDYTFVATLLATGLRISEACALRPGDIDSTANLIHVRRGKGFKRRSVQLGDRHLRLLRRYWEVVQPHPAWLFPARRLVAPGRVAQNNRWADKPVHPDTMRKRLHKLTERAGLTRRVVPHDIRRTYATWLLETGVDLRIVQVLLGHASPETTARYTQVRPELIRRTPSPLELL